MAYERISIPPEDAQFIATRKFQKTEIPTIYGIATYDRRLGAGYEQQYRALGYGVRAVLPNVIHRPHLG